MREVPFRVAFAGHRALSEDTAASVAKVLPIVFAAIAEGCASAGKGHVNNEADWRERWQSLLRISDGPGGADQPTVRPWLMAGHAAGADRLAVTAWRESQCGPVHAVFPFCDAAGTQGLDDPTETDGYCDLTSGSWIVSQPASVAISFERCTALDGASARTELPPRDPHLDQARFLVRFSDMLVAVWDGRSPAGPGGTADAVRLALGRGLPVVWIDIGQDCSTRLLDPARLWQDAHLEELAEALGAKPNAIAPIIDVIGITALAKALVHRITLPPSGEPDVSGHADGHGASEEASLRDFEKADAELAVTPGKDIVSMVGWRRRIAGSWPVFRRLLAWDHVVAAPAGVEIVRTIPPGLSVIRRAMSRAEDVAQVYGDLHRTLQVWLMLIAVAAVVVGTAAAVAPGKKWWFVVAELGLALLALGVWRLRLLASNHQRWSDSRRYAERLRVMVATWPLGFDVNDDRADPPSTWTEWRARAVMRLAGPPVGALTARMLLTEAMHARDDPNGIVGGQRAYHAANWRLMDRAHRHLHKAETIAFYGLMAALALFALAYPFFPHQPEPSWPPDPTFLPNRLGGLLLMLSAIVPAFAAAVIALEAKIGFQENAERSARLARSFGELFRDMEGARGEPRLSPVRLAEELRAAGRLHLADADAWREGALRREIVKL